MIGQSVGIEFLRLLSAIPYTGETSPGVLFITKPDMGKTYLLTHIESKMFRIISDITGYGFERFILNIARGGEIPKGYIIVPEMKKVFDGKRNSFQQLIALLNLALEEGLKEIHTKMFSVKFSTPLHLGFIGAITTEEFEYIKKRLHTGGTLSRMLLYRFDYELSDVKRIKELIASGIDLDEISIPVDIELLDRQSIVKIHLKRVKDLIIQMGELIQTDDETKFRITKNIRKLVKAAALVRHYNEAKEPAFLEVIEADERDICKVFTLLPFIQNLNPAPTDLEYKILKLLCEYPLGMGMVRISESFNELYTFSEVQNAIYRLLNRGLIIREQGVYLPVITKHFLKTYPEELKNTLHEPIE